MPEIKPEQQPEQQDDANNPDQNLSVWQVIGSVFAAAFGVQSDKNRQRDFTRAKPSTYIIAGILFTLAFILVLAGIVKLVLNVIAT